MTSLVSSTDGRGVGDDVGELGGAVARVDRHDDGAEERDAEQRVDVLHAVRHHDRDAVAAAHAERVQGARHRARERSSSSGADDPDVGEGDRRRRPAVRSAAATSMSPNVVTSIGAVSSCGPPRVVALAERVQGRARRDGVARPRAAARRSARPRRRATCRSGRATPATIASNGRVRTSLRVDVPRDAPRRPPCRRTPCSPRASSRAA